MEAGIGIIGGSGLYELDGFETTEERSIETPFGAPSDHLVGGTFQGRRVWFLPRHARGHRILPHEINHRANIWALRSLNVRWLVCVSAVGSLKEHYRPRDIVLPDQYFDRSGLRKEHTFFGNGIVGHVAFAEPTSPGLREILFESATQAGLRIHQGGTYVHMDGPAFSTRAESVTNRKLGFDVVGMTNLPEAKLAREAGIALATLAMVTDYDCWKVHEEPVTATAVLEHVHANVKAAQLVLAQAIPQIPVIPNWPEHSALRDAIITPRHLWPEQTALDLAPLLESLETY